MNRLEIMWAAGFFDGEGHARFDAGSTIRLQVCQVDREVLDRFRHAVGDIGTIYGPYKRVVSTWQPRFEYRVYGPNAYRVAVLLYSVVGSVKRAQLRAAMEGWAK